MSSIERATLSSFINAQPDQSTLASQAINSQALRTHEAASSVFAMPFPQLSPFQGFGALPVIPFQAQLGIPAATPLWTSAASLFPLRQEPPERVWTARDVPPTPEQPPRFSEDAYRAYRAYKEHTEVLKNSLLTLQKFRPLNKKEKQALAECDNPPTPEELAYWDENSRITKKPVVTENEAASARKKIRAEQDKERRAEAKARKLELLELQQVGPLNDAEAEKLSQFTARKKHSKQTALLEPRNHETVSSSSDVSHPKTRKRKASTNNEAETRPVVTKTPAEKSKACRERTKARKLELLELQQVGPLNDAEAEELSKLTARKKHSKQTALLEPRNHETVSSSSDVSHPKTRKRKASTNNEAETRPVVTKTPAEKAKMHRDKIKARKSILLEKQKNKSINDDELTELQTMNIRDEQRRIRVNRNKEKKKVQRQQMARSEPLSNEASSSSSVSHLRTRKRKANASVDSISTLAKAPAKQAREYRKKIITKGRELEEQQRTQPLNQAEWEELQSYSDYQKRDAEYKERTTLIRSAAIESLDGETSSRNTLSTAAASTSPSSDPIPNLPFPHNLFNHEYNWWHEPVEATVDDVFSSNGDQFVSVDHEGSSGISSEIIDEVLSRLRDED